MPNAVDPNDADPRERSNGDLPDDSSGLDLPEDAEDAGDDSADGDLEPALDEAPPLPPAGEVLTAVADESRGLPFADLPALNAADDATVGRVLALWPKISAERRRELLAALQQHAEDDVLLDFDRIHLSALFDADVATRILAIHGLWEHDRHEYAALLADLVGSDPEAIVRAEAAVALGNFVIALAFGMLPDDLAERIAEALRDRIEDVTEDDEVRGAALESVGSSSDEWVGELIAEQYETGSTRLRLASVVAMGRHGSDDWLPVLIQSFEDEDDEVRAGAAVAAGHLLLETAIEPLALLLDDGQQPEVQVAAIRAIGEIAGVRAQEILTQLLESGDEHIVEAAQLALEESRMMEVDFQAEARRK
ncbi:MAG: HEAT repeat domain-containing protein [Chloroflexi bacterium]|nr:HEAT repeat domain-containing protein [Chloroflexota bacterium]